MCTTERHDVCGCGAACTGTGAGCVPGRPVGRLPALLLGFVAAGDPALLRPGCDVAADLAVRDVVEFSAAFVVRAGLWVMAVMLAATPATASAHSPPTASGVSSARPRGSLGQAIPRPNPRRTGSSTNFHDSAATTTLAAAAIAARVVLKPPAMSAGAVSTISG